MSIGRWHREPGVVSVGVLGPLEVSVDGRPLALTTGRLRTVLATLAISAGQVVSVDRLVAALWTGEQPPAKPHAAVRMYVSRLRGMLGAGSITGTGAGYALNLSRDQVDVLRFTTLLESAAAIGDRSGEHEQLTRALVLWRGNPFEDIDSAWLEQSQSPQLVERYLAAVERRVDLDIAAGRTEGLIVELHQLTIRHPLRESLWARLLTVLDRSGRQAEALEQYETIRVRLAEELGTDPGPALQQLYRDLLSGGIQPSQPSPAGSIAPRQLPAPPHLFTGRAAELADLGRLPDASTVVITAIDGMAGVGKTALAVHLAHRIADHYPDGQLFIDLHGYTPGVKPVEPAEALDHALRALGIPGPQIPASVDERAALYRTRLADQRVLILLDNAATEAQVQPLLPGSPGCLVLVTSRRRLAGLDHTHTLSLDTLPTSDAVTLFVQTAGEQRVADPELSAELVELCGRLPLAIRIAAARLRSRPSWSLSHLVERLRDQRHRLSELAAGQRSVTAALDLSYQDLSFDQRQAYRLLGMHPGLEIDRYAAAALLGSTLPHASRMLDQLLDAHLLLEPAAGRYRFHDLTRAHAARTAALDQAEPTGRAALDRLLDYYRDTARRTMDAAYPYERARRPSVPQARTATPELSDPAPALAWLDAELPNLSAAVLHAAEHGRPEHVLHLSAILHHHLRRRGRYRDAEVLHQCALVTARATGDRPGELEARNGLGRILRLRGRPEPATDHYRRALEIARAMDHQPGELDALTGLGWVHLWQGRHEQATDHFEQALRIAQATGHQLGELEALAGLGHVHVWQGRHQLATDHYERALRAARAIGHQPGELDALIGLGWVELRQSRYGRATDHFGQALRITRATGHRTGELDVLAGLGQIHRRQGRYPQAAEQYQHALRIARAIGHSVGELDALTGLGQIHRRQGRHEQATDHYQQLLELAKASTDRNFEFEAWQGLGRLRHAAGHPEDAVSHHGRALALAAALGQPLDQARAHDGLAHAHHALDQPEQARGHWQHALDLLTGLGIDHTEDEETTVAAIRAHLAGLDRGKESE